MRTRARTHMRALDVKDVDALHLMSGNFITKMLDLTGPALPGREDLHRIAVGDLYQGVCRAGAQLHAGSETVVDTLCDLVDLTTDRIWYATGSTVDLRELRRFLLEAATSATVSILLEITAPSW